MARTQALERHREPVEIRSGKAAPRQLAPVVSLASWGAEQDETAMEDALDVLSRSSAAAFAVDRSDRIVYWNQGAEKLLGFTAAEAIGRACHEVIGGHDAFGNRYCTADCPIMSLMKSGVLPEPFCMEMRKREPQRLKVRVKTVAFPEPGPDFTALVHLVDADTDERLEKLVAELRATAKGAAPAPAPASSPNPLTRREREIVDLLSNGYAALNIAARLDLSHATVRNHIQNILRKMEVHSQVEAIAVAFRNGWI